MTPGRAGDDEQTRDDGLRPYPAPGRPEQPMHSSPSPWPWVIGGVVLAIVVFGGLLVFVMYAIGSNAG